MATKTKTRPKEAPPTIIATVETRVLDALLDQTLWASGDRGEWRTSEILELSIFNNRLTVVTTNGMALARATAVVPSLGRSARTFRLSIKWLRDWRARCRPAVTQLAVRKNGLFFNGTPIAAAEDAAGVPLRFPSYEHYTDGLMTISDTVQLKPTAFQRGVREAAKGISAYDDIRGALLPITLHSAKVTIGGGDVVDKVSNTVRVGVKQLRPIPCYDAEGLELSLVSILEQTMVRIEYYAAGPVKTTIILMTMSV